MTLRLVFPAPPDAREIDDVTRRHVLSLLACNKLTPADIARMANVTESQVRIIAEHRRGRAR